MDADESTQPSSALRSRNAAKKAKAARAARIEKKRHRKPRNKIAFPAHPKKGKRK
jgi:hypothetical protein